MASKSINIPNMKEAIEAGVVPGAFNSAKTVFEFPMLSYETKRSVMNWQVKVCLMNSEDKMVTITNKMLSQPTPQLDGYKAVISILAFQDGGKERDNVPTIVTEGKNIGKKNATNVITQAIRDALSLYNKQNKKASKVSEDKFVSMPPPMLVRKLADTKEAELTTRDFEAGVMVQKKLNGVHLIVFLNNGEITKYSRSGHVYPGLVNINSEMIQIITTAPPINPEWYADANDDAEATYKRPIPYFAGELYLHGKPLNWISGQARKDVDEGILEYHIFDVFFPHAIFHGHNMCSLYRQLYLDSMMPKNAVFIKRVENFGAKNLEEVQALAKKFIHEGYEGAIVRKNLHGYEYSYSNYHSPNVIKIKPFLDSEFKVIGFESGKKGKDLGAIVWVCESDKGETFNVVPNMPYEIRYKLFSKLSGDESVFDKYVKGKLLTVQYSELSAKTGVPQQPKGICFRTYESGESDPVEDVLAS